MVVTETASPIIKRKTKQREAVTVDAYNITWARSKKRSLRDSLTLIYICIYSYIYIYNVAFLHLVLCRKPFDLKSR